MQAKLELAELELGEAVLYAAVKSKTLVQAVDWQALFWLSSLTVVSWASFELM